MKQIRLKMKATWPKGGYPINTVHIVPENFAKVLIKQGYAVAIEEIKPIETAMTDEGETTDSPASKKRGK